VDDRATPSRWFDRAPGNTDNWPEQEGQVVEAWKGIDGLQRAQWADASQEERLATLQKAENGAANIQGRDPMPVTLDTEARPEEKGYYDGERIRIGEYSLNNDDVSEVANTLAHEGRHAYQDYAIEHPGFHSDGDDVRSWRENMQPGNYVEPDDQRFNYDEYRNQPIERDAFRYGDTIEQGVYGTGRDNE